MINGFTIRLNNQWSPYFQGVDFAPRAPGTRLLIAVWWFVTLILIAFYTANLAAFLTISLRVPPINSWSDLLKSDMEYGSLKSGSTRDFFFNTKLEPFAQLGAWMKKNTHALASNVDEGVERVRSSKVSPHEMGPGEEGG